MNKLLIRLLTKHHRTRPTCQLQLKVVCVCVCVIPCFSGNKHSELFMILKPYIDIIKIMLISAQTETNMNKHTRTDPPGFCSECCRFHQELQRHRHPEPCYFGFHLWHNPCSPLIIEQSSCISLSLVAEATGQPQKMK